MQLPQEAIIEFQTIWQKEFGEALSYADAEIKARELLYSVYFLLSGKKLSTDLNLTKEEG